MLTRGRDVGRQTAQAIDLVAGALALAVMAFAAMPGIVALLRALAG